MSKIVWLASYPKSGNTWMRAFLNNYIRNPEKPVNINDLGLGGVACSRDTFEELAGVEASDLTPTQIDNSRPMVYRLLAQESRADLYVKVHDAYQITASGEPMFPADATLGVIFIIRHPCDVAVSFAHFFSRSIDWIIAQMNDPEAYLTGKTERLQVPLNQKMFSWSGHAQSWLNSGLNVCATRYEDMLAQPQETFGRVVRFLGLTYDAARLQKALEFSSFEEMQAQEQRDNFFERPQSAPNFFRQGKAGKWRESLSEAQAAALVSVHVDVMRQFGYLDEKGNVL